MIIPNTQIGRLIPKHHRQLALVRYPPMTGPMAYEHPPVIAKKDQFLAFSCRLTLSEMMVLTRTEIPAQATPWKPRPSRRTGYEDVGAAVQRVLPRVMRTRTA